MKSINASVGTYYVPPSCLHHLLGGTIFVPPFQIMKQRRPSGKVSALGARGFQVRNPIPLKIRRVLVPLHAKSYVGGQTPSRWCGAEGWRGEAQLKCHPPQMTKVQNYEVRPNIVLVLLQNGTLIQLN
ncbi:hypothetical protein AVEN_44080-1 [Araneus ventricosus]|uniref:Uncharacterized protein n=1 Tax=Araneus ventricosus TaxID=182803 RepID=A0A4Y2R0M3_ARAVE|nr:hypothetical protein AVEN_44080-1 [Araneus ventricosus]